jgi:hypothetical protein
MNAQWNESWRVNATIAFRSIRILWGTHISMNLCTKRELIFIVLSPFCFDPTILLNCSLAYWVPLFLAYTLDITNWKSLFKMTRQINVSAVYEYIFSIVNRTQYFCPRPRQAHWNWKVFYCFLLAACFFASLTIMMLFVWFLPLISICLSRLQTNSDNCVANLCYQQKK